MLHKRLSIIYVNLSNYRIGASFLDRHATPEPPFGGLRLQRQIPLKRSMSRTSTLVTSLSSMIRISSLAMSCVHQAVA